MLQHTIKILRPYLRYFHKLTFPSKAPEHMFHVFSVDIELDSEGSPALLEINSNPSLKVEYEAKGPIQQKVPKDYLERQELEKQVFTPSCDLHIKSM